MFQSPMFWSQFCIRAPAAGGTQFTPFAAAMSCGRSSSIEMNHSSSTRKTISSLHRQHTG
jgi:hypothetical protein